MSTPEFPAHTPKDFGFSFEDNKEAIEQAEADQRRIDRIVNLVIPLLTNLAKEPHKETIYWPNREEKLRELIDKIQEIAKGY